MLVVGFEGTSLNPQVKDLIANRRMGGVILFERNYESPEQLTCLNRELQALATSVSPNVPLFISVDQEGGRVSRLKAPFTAFPPPFSIGKAQSESLACRFGRALGRELRAVGINMDYAPVLDIHTNPDNPVIGHRAFSELPEWAGRLACSFMDGFHEAGILPVGKHFPGHGDTSQDSHLTLPRVDRDRETLERVELIPFRAAIDHGLDIMMTAHVVYPAWDPDYPATFSRIILQDILRKQLGFRGLIISDDLEMKAVGETVPFESCPALGVSAGIDLFLVCNAPDKAIAFQEQMIRDMECGDIDRKRVEDSVRRVMDIKRGISPHPLEVHDFVSLVSSHRELAAEMQSFLVDVS